jgi:hypothetical protein
MCVFLPATALAETAHECLLTDAAREDAPHGCPLAAGTLPSAGHDHGADLAGRAEKGMGFSREQTTHHFLLSPEGGSIEVTANDRSDTASLDQIRKHLAHVREMFAAGDFSIPMFVHDTVPPGISTMKRRAGAIRYSFEDLASGGRVRISTADLDARDAIHDFLRFQIAEHRTGDPVAIR